MAVARQTITFVLNTERDRDIVRWLEGQDNKSAAIREAIRTQFGRGNITPTDLYEAIQDLKRYGWAPGHGIQAHTVTASDEPADVAAALDSLGL